MPAKLSVSATVLLSLTAIVPLAACGDDDGHVESCGLEANCEALGTVDFAQGITREGNDGNLSVRLISADPAPPRGGEEDAHDVDGGTEEGGYVENHWVVEVLDGDGARVSDAELSVRTWSMDCMHFGVELDDDEIVVTQATDGTFSWTHAYLHGGPWSVQISVNADGESDLVEFPFCLEQTETNHHH